MNTVRLISLSTLLLTGLVHATPSGLNNIPTADTAPDDAVVIQVYDLFGEEPHDFASGFKTGMDLKWVDLEWGLDSHLAPGPAGPLFFQTKVAFSPWEEGKIAVGVAGVALSDTDVAGDPFTYAVLSQNVGFARLHAGYGVQTGGNTVLLGIDKNVEFLGRNLNLNADLVQIRDQDGWMPAVGLKYDLSKNIVFETWTNMPDEGKCEYVLKLNFVIPFGFSSKLPNPVSK
jgi:hypothetical protein